MSVPTAELTAPASAAPSPTPPTSLSQRLGGGRFYLLLSAGALVIAVLSLLIPSTPSYDPWSWLVWGREIVHLKLHTTGGPSWKPLPVIFTTLFAPFGKAAPDMWLVLARMGGVVAVVMVFKLAVRLTQDLQERAAQVGQLGALATSVGAPLLAGLIAAVGLAFSGGFISDNALGYSEGLLTAAVLIAVERHLDGHPRQAFAIGLVAALDRPEIWLFWGPYGLWLWWKDPGARKLVLGLFVLIPVLWFLPEYWGSGHFFRGVTRAHHPRSNSSAFATCPFCSELVKHAWPTVLLRIKLAAVLAVGAAALALWRTRKAGIGLRSATPHVRAQAAIILAGVLGFGWWVLIALMTQAGFSGNDRYLVLGAALIEIAGSVGFGWAALKIIAVLRDRVRLRGSGSGSGTADGRRLTEWSAVAVMTLVFLLGPNWVGNNLISIQRTHKALVYQAHLRADVARAVGELGGAASVVRCGAVMTEGFQVPMVAWTLGVHTLQVQAPPTSLAPAPWPRVILQARDTSHAALLPTPAQIIAWEHDGAHYNYFRVRTIRVFSTCRAKVRQ